MKVYVFGNEYVVGDKRAIEVAKDLDTVQGIQDVTRGDNVREVGRRGPEPSMAESQLSELQNMRVLLEEANLLTRNLAYHRRAKLEARLELVIYELERQIEELRAERG